MEENTKVERVCPVCGETYLARPIRLKWGRETTCSRTCSYIFRGDKQETLVTLTCAVCHAEFRRSPSKIKGKHGAQFCSRACHYAGISAGITRRIVDKPYVYTEDGLSTLRKAGATAYASGNLLRYPQAEHDLARDLMRRGIPFVHQFVVEYEGGAFVGDFFFPSSGLIVELDLPSTHARANKRQRDRQFDERAYTLGYRVLRLDQRLPTEDLAQAIVEACGAG